MLLTLVAAVPPTIAALGAWFGGRGCPAKLERIEALVETVVDWQVDHDRLHKTYGTGGMQ